MRKEFHLSEWTRRHIYWQEGARLKWEKIEGHERYSVSNNGDIRNDTTNIILRPVLDERGYAHVTLCPSHKRVSVHRIVASAFLPRGENETQVNHKNGVHEDNRAENLEWCTARENIRHKYDVLKYRWENHIRRMTEVNSHPVVCCETGTVYQSMAQAARSVGTNSGHICECIKGRRKTAAGYHWRADEEAEKALQEMEDKNVS
jgi:hypothetical protein